MTQTLCDYCGGIITEANRVKYSCTTVFTVLHGKQAPYSINYGDFPRSKGDDICTSCDKQGFEQLVNKAGCVNPERG